jgi:hypothetical protein
MHKGNANGAAEFEPPKYLASLIAAINDGAKAAQGGALAFLRFKRKQRKAAP